ncbi:MAG: four helix bundle protein [Verrucomicrobia bacterium]|nr:MAG: four helix bundle protein [Verrucomicrobiota bacterium]
MTYERFEDIPVWQAGIELTTRVFRLTAHTVFHGQGDLANQIQRAALSVPNNIAEGFERGSTAELIAFLYYARGSAGEVRSVCHVLLRMEEFNNYKSQITDVFQTAESISRQLAGWLKQLKESDMPGQRRFTEKDRQRQEQQQRADDFMAKLRREQEERLRQRREAK